MLDTIPVAPQDINIFIELKGYLLEFLQNNAVQEIYTTTADGRNLRSIILKPDELLKGDPVCFVGFFSQRKKEVQPDDKKWITELDSRLCQEIKTFPAIMAYLTLQLPDRENYSNLVIFSQQEGLTPLKESRTHYSAAQLVSPRYYESVRIHKGWFEKGITGPFSFLSTNLYSFEGSSTQLVERRVL